LVVGGKKMAKQRRKYRKYNRKNSRSGSKYPHRQKYYVVRNGREVGIFMSWPKCKSLVDHYRNAEFKSFTTYEAALRWYLGDGYTREEKEEIVEEILATNWRG